MTRDRRTSWAALALGLASGCTPVEPPVAGPPAPGHEAPASWSDAWILAEGARYRHDDAYRRAVLERSLVNHDNTYSRIRLDAYGLGTRGWDKLPVWNPRSMPVTASVAAQLERGQPVTAPVAPLWDGTEPTTMDGWVELGRAVFFGYPMRAEIYMEWALEQPAVAAAVGVERTASGDVPGLVVFADVDGDSRVGITCATCHAAVEHGAVVAGRARRAFDYGRLRLAYFADDGRSVPPRLARRMSQWGPGRADVTEDDDEDPVAIPDLWGLRDQRWLTQAGTIRHETPVALAIRQETQLIDSNHAMVRPPRALSWALATYVYSLSPPVDPAPSPPPAAEGRALFARHCGRCHENAAGGGGVIAARDIGTDPALATSRGRGTGGYRVPALLGAGAGAPYLHDGSVRTLDELLGPERLAPDYAGGRLGPGPISGHEAGTALDPAQRAALAAFVRSL